MTISDVINPRCYQGLYQSCLVHFPSGVASYISTHVDTLSKLLHHVLMLIAICDVFLFLVSWKISFLTSFVAILLGAQNACVFLILNNDKISFSPRFLAPSDFIIGMALGITIGGTVLAFFLSAIFSKVPLKCESIEDITRMYSCEQRRGTANHVWWWSTVMFWLNMTSCVLLVASRNEISYNAQPQYQSIDGAPMDAMNNQQQHFQQSHEAQQLQQPAQTFVGDYSNIPDVQGV
jgi:hypothetical protein